MEYQVALSADSSTLIVTRHAAARRRGDTLVVEGGRLIGFDGGEFGGSIQWMADAGTDQMIAPLNLHSFVRMKDTVWALTGLAHLTSNRGQLIRLDRTGEVWRVSETVDLGAAPRAVIRLPDDTLLILAAGKLISVPASHQPLVLHENRTWVYTYPTNLVRDRGGAIYLGMRSGVARLIPKEKVYEEDWLMPTTCTPQFR